MLASGDGPQRLLFLADLDVHQMQDNDVLCLALLIDNGLDPFLHFVCAGFVWVNAHDQSNLFGDRLTETVRKDSDARLVGPDGDSLELLELYCIANGV